MVEMRVRGTYAGTSSIAGTLERAGTRGGASCANSARGVAARGELTARLRWLFHAVHQDYLACVCPTYPPRSPFGYVALGRSLL